MPRLFSQPEVFLARTESLSLPNFRNNDSSRYSAHFANNLLPVVNEMKKVYHDGGVERSVSEGQSVCICSHQHIYALLSRLGHHGQRYVHPYNVKPRIDEVLSKAAGPYPDIKNLLATAKRFFHRVQELLHYLRWNAGPSRGVVNAGHAVKRNCQIMLPPEEQNAFSEIRNFRNTDSRLLDPTYNHPIRNF